MINSKPFKKKANVIYLLFFSCLIAVLPRTVWGSDHDPKQGNKYLLFMGEVGAGVSTVLNYALGHRFTSDNLEHLKLVPSENKNNKPLAEMRENDSDKTKQPQAYSLGPGGIQLVDTPGFSLHTTSDSIKAITQFIKDQDQVQAITYTVPYKLIKNKNYFRESLKDIDDFLINPSLIVDRFHLFINKVPSTHTLGNVIQKLTKINNKTDNNGYYSNTFHLLIQKQNIHLINPTDNGESWEKAFEKIKKTIKEPIPSYLFSEDKRKISNLKLSLSKKSAKLQELKSANNQFITLMQEKDNEITLLEKQTNKQDAIIKKLKKEGSKQDEKAEQVQEKIDELAKKDDQIKALKIEVKKKKDALDDVKTTTSKKDRELKKQKTTIDHLTSKVRELEKKSKDLGQDKSNLAPPQKTGEIGGSINLERTVIISVLIVVVGWLLSRLQGSANNNKKVQQDNSISSLR